MEINLNNYEAYLLDYSEGNLSVDMVVQLKAFVQTHPELEIDLEDTSLPVFDKEDFKVDFKENLLKNSNDTPNSDVLEYLEGNLNGLDKISFELKLAQDIELQRDLERLKKTIQQPELTDIFNSKESLVKTEEQLILNNAVISYFENTLSSSEKSAFERELKTSESLRKKLTLVEKTRLSADASLVYPAKEELLKEAKVFVLFSYRTAMAAAVLIVVGLSLLFLFNNHEGRRVHENNLAVKSLVKKNHKSLPAINSVHTTNVNDDILVVDKKETRKAKNSNQEIKDLAVNNATISSSQQPTFSTVKKDTSALVTNTVINSLEPAYGEPVIHYSNINALAVTTDNEEQVNDIEKPKKGFWKRAVNVARQMNGLGVKAVKGEEKENEFYSLSFNSFSVERK